MADGRVRLHIFVDESSVEVFAGDGRTVLTSVILPDPESQGIELFATGGEAVFRSLDVWRLRSAWRAGQESAGIVR